MASRAPLWLSALLLTLLTQAAGCGGGKKTAPGVPITVVRTPATPAMAASPAASPATVATTAAAQQYTVQAGDTLNLIAQRFNTTVGTLRQANGISSDAIRVGQTLQIPATAATATTSLLKPPADTRPARPIYRGRTDTNAVALTFDAGADVGYTQLILDTLKRNGIHATFGMTGQWAQDNPDLVKRMAADGHDFINHTWDHSSFTGLSTQGKPLSQAQRFDEVDRTEAIVHQLTGKTTLPYFRAPFGDRDNSVETDVGLRGYRYDILWTVDTRGWAKATPAQIIATSIKGAEPGAIYVMHVGSQSQDGPALQGVIDALRQRGFTFATISDLVPAP